MNEKYNFDKIATDAKHIDTRYTWVRDDSGLVHFYKRKDYFSLSHYMTLAFHQDSRIGYVDFIKAVNAICQTLSELDYAKDKVNKLNKEKNKNARGP